MDISQSNTRKIRWSLKFVKDKIPFVGLWDIFVIILFILFFRMGIINAENKDNNLWKISGYCQCSKCTYPYNDGITASGKKVKVGMVANNWLPFGTKVFIKGLGEFTVEDRGSKKYFGTKKEKRQCIDVYMDSHKEAKEFGVKFLKVEVIK